MRKGQKHSIKTRKKMSIAQRGNSSHKNCKHSFETKQKISQVLKGKKPWNTGKKLSEIHCKKISLAKLGKKLSKETREKMGLAKRGNKYCLGLKQTEEHKKKISQSLIGKNLKEKIKKACLYCQAIFEVSPSKKNRKYCNNKCKYIVRVGKKHSAMHKRKIGDAVKGINNPMYGKHSKPHTIDKIKNCYQNIIFRSSWEVKYAKYLDRNDIKWIYEPKPKFKLIKNSPYGADFYLPELNKYIEIKGLWNRNGCRDKEKIEEFKKIYPNIKFELLMKEELKNIGIKI